MYSVLTSGLKVPPETTLLLLERDVLDFLQIVAMTADDYHALLKHLVSLDIRGGKIYDGVIAYAVWKAEADWLLTANKKHFDTIYPAHAAQIIEP